MRSATETPSRRPYTKKELHGNFLLGRIHRRCDLQIHRDNKSRHASIQERARYTRFHLYPGTQDQNAKLTMKLVKRDRQREAEKAKEKVRDIKERERKRKRRKKRQSWQRQDR